MLGATLAKAVVAAALSLGSAGGSFQAPAYNHDFPDPDVVAVGNTYWAYATGSGGLNLQVSQSSNLANWSTPVDPLPVLPTWATTGHTWAPGVVHLGQTFVMYYTVRETSSGRQCISVATSTTPAGPFTDSSSGPLICQLAHGGSIDPSPFVSPTGVLYLVWKSDDNALGNPTHIWGQRMTANGLSTVSGTVPSLLLSETAAWQAPSAEGPTLFDNGGRYYLFYGANNYDTANSGIGYATASAPLGTYTNKSTLGPWLGTRGNAKGPQGPATFTDLSGHTRLALAAWYGTVGYENGGVRSLWIANLTFSMFGTPSAS